MSADGIVHSNVEPAMPEYRPGDERVTAEADAAEADAPGMKDATEANLPTIHEVKAEIGRRLSRQFGVPLTRKGSYLEHAESGRRFIIVVSKRHLGPTDYWYGYHTEQQSRLVRAKEGYFVLGCLDMGRAFAVPVDEMNRMALHMNSKPKQGDNRHYQVHVQSTGERVFIHINNDLPDFDIRRFEIAQSNGELTTDTDRVEHRYAAVETDTSGMGDSDTNFPTIQEVKAEIGRRLSRKFEIPLTRRRSCLEHVESGRRFIVAVSRFYGGPSDYWYGYHTKQQSLLAEVEEGYFVLGCLDTGRAFAVPADEMNRIAQRMKYTLYLGDKENKRYHVFIRTMGERVFIHINNDNPDFDIRQFEI